MPLKIYALYYFDADTKRFFYVGRSNDVARRIAEHIRATPEGHEDKYGRLRDLERKGIRWDVEVLREIPHGEYPPDNERWFVIDLTRKGHELMNMRHGSVEHRRELARLVASVEIRSVADVTVDRVRSIDRAAVRRSGQSRRLRRRILESTLRKVGVPDLNSDTLLPRRLRARLLRAGFDAIGDGLELKRLVQIARPDKQYLAFKKFVREVEEANPLFGLAIKRAKGTSIG